MGCRRLKLSWELGDEGVGCERLGCRPLKLS